MKKVRLQGRINSQGKTSSASWFQIYVLLESIHTESKKLDKHGEKKIEDQGGRITRFFESLPDIIKDSGYHPPEQSAEQIREVFGRVSGSPFARDFLVNAFSRFDHWLRRSLPSRLESDIARAVALPFFAQYLWLQPADHNVELITLFSQAQTDCLKQAAKKLDGEKLELAGLTSDSKSLTSFAIAHTLLPSKSLAGYAAMTGISDYFEKWSDEPLVAKPKEAEKTKDPNTPQRELYYHIIKMAIRESGTNHSTKYDNMSMFYVPVTFGPQALFVVQIVSPHGLTYSDRRTLVQVVHQFAGSMDLLSDLYATQLKLEHRRQQLMALPKVLTENLVHDLLKNLKAGVLRSINESLDNLNENPDLLDENPDLKLIRSDLQDAKQTFETSEKELKQGHQKIVDTLDQGRIGEIDSVVNAAVDAVRRGRFRHHLQIERSGAWGSGAKVNYNEGLISGFRDVIENAFDATEDVKKNPKLTITIEPKVSLDGLTGFWIRISLHDNGPGFPNGEVSKFTQYGESTKPLGSGMGLYLAKRMFEIHGGTLKIDDTVKAGANIVVTLPREDS